MNIRLKLEDKLDIYFDPKVSIQKLLGDLDKAGKFDMRMVRIILVEILESLDSKKK